MLEGPAVFLSLPTSAAPRRVRTVRRVVGSAALPWGRWRCWGAPSSSCPRRAPPHPRPGMMSRCTPSSPFSVALYHGAWLCGRAAAGRAGARRAGRLLLLLLLLLLRGPPSAWGPHAAAHRHIFPLPPPAPASYPAHLHGADMWGACTKKNGGESAPGAKWDRLPGRFRCSPHPPAKCARGAPRAPGLHPKWDFLPSPACPPRGYTFSIFMK